MTYHWTNATVYDTPPAKWVHKKGETKLYTSREDAYEKCFAHLDSNFDGNLNLAELSRLVKIANPTHNMSETQRLMQLMDINHDSEVSLEEFRIAMAEMTKDMDDERMELFVADILYRDHASHRGGDQYFHPTNNEEYLNRSQLLPVMRAGLEALVKFAEEERVRVATWEEFDHHLLPDVWSPFCPLQWMAQYLREHNPQLYHSEPLMPKPFHQLTREEKLEMLFHHLDRDNNGMLELKELLALASKVSPEEDMEEARQSLAWMDQDKDSLVSMEEFMEAMAFLFSAMDDQDLDDTVRELMASSHLAYFTRQEKLQMAFRSLDTSQDGRLDLDEIIAFGRSFGHGVDVVKAKKTILFMDTDGDRLVDQDEFLVAMGQLTNKLSDEKFDQGIHRILNGHRPNREFFDPMINLSTKMKSLVSEMPTHNFARQMAVQDALRHYSEKDQPDNPNQVVFVDMRTEEESTVSTIAGAVRINRAFPMNDLDLLRTNMDFLDPLFVQKTPSEPPVTPSKKGGKKPGKAETPSSTAKGTKMPTPAVPAAQDPVAGGGKVNIEPGAVVICFDSMGLRGGLGAIALEKTLGIPVYNLCGGIFQWYNEGGDLVDSSNTVVQKVHPQHKNNIGLLKRRNEYRTSQHEEELAAKVKAKRTKDRFSHKPR